MPTSVGRQNGALAKSTVCSCIQKNPSPTLTHRPRTFEIGQSVPNISRDGPNARRTASSAPGSQIAAVSK